MKSHVNLNITGKVQGVWYRKWICEQARRLEITGYVENKKDGSVYIEAESDDTILKEFITLCYEGPQHAHVDAVEILAKETPKNFQEFNING